MRTALTISQQVYNEQAGLALFCPITSRKKGYPFEVEIPEGMGINGVILSDQLKSLDWEVREAKFIKKVPSRCILEVMTKIYTLLN